jgi:hypothetical protein
MISKEQLADEQRKEREYNKLFELVISKSPFGQWYGLMIGASNLVTKNLPKRVGVDEDGRPMVVYKSDAQKLMGVWAEPTHKLLARKLGQKKYGEAFQAIFAPSLGHIKEMQRQKKAIFFDISPKEVGEMHNKKVSQKKKEVVTGNKSVTLTPDDVEVPIVKEKTNYIPVVVISLLAIATVLTIIYYPKK